MLKRKKHKCEVSAVAEEGQCAASGAQCPPSFPDNSGLETRELFHITEHLICNQGMFHQKKKKVTEAVKCFQIFIEICTLKPYGRRKRMVYR